MLIGGRNPILRPMHVTSDHSGGDQSPVVTGAALLPKLQWTKHANARPTTVTAEAARDRGANCTTLPNTDVSGGNDLPHSGDSAATVGDCVAMCANDCSCNVAVYVSDIKKCYIKHLPAATDPPGQGGAVHTPGPASAQREDSPSHCLQASYKTSEGWKALRNAAPLRRCASDAAVC